MKPLSNDLREKFVHAVLIEGMTCRAAGERFAVSHSAVIKIVRQFVETDAIDPQKVGGSRKPALVKCYDMVRAIVDETPDLTLSQIADEIVARGGPKVGKSTVDRTLARLDLKFQKKSLIADEQTRDGRRPERGFFRRVAQRFINSARFIFFDETAAKTDIRRVSGRAPGGERLVASVPHGHWKTTTFVAGLEPGRNCRPGRLRRTYRRSIVPGLH